MSEVITQIKQQFMADLETVKIMTDLEAIDQRYFSRASGSFSALMKELGNLSPEERKVRGQELNTLKNELTSALGMKRSELETNMMGNIGETESIDVTEVVKIPQSVGHVHPMSQALWDMETVAREMGFIVEDGPELETDYYNFEALNIPATHPARDMSDTFYIKGHSDWLMRTHVSNMQVRLLKKYGVPLRVAYPGRCFRNEATDARHEHTFYQYETLVVGEGITLTDMVGVIKEILKGLFKKDIEIRLRPKFYPFVEPGVNGEMTCFLCDGKGCRVCKGTGWMEIFGAGMVHPNVLKAGGVDPKKYSGFAFGMGLTRMVMLKYGIDDVRLLQSGDLRFLEQF